MHLVVIFCRMVEDRRAELAAGDINMGHPLSAYHLIKFWETLMNKIKNHSNFSGKSNFISIFNFK